ncbi:MAG: hypothetical protein HFJ87_09305 [Muribaculaceae bacterium]|nr:hypothetical protein [Muribaculaceae bacterium]
MKKNESAGAVMLPVCGKEYPCRVTMGAMVLFKRATGKSPSRFSEDDVEEMVQFVYCCVKAACKADGVELGMDFEEFACGLEPEAMTRFYEGLGGAAGKKAMAATARK